MWMLAWLGLAEAAQTDCVTKDLAWRWLSTTEGTAGAKAGERVVHASTVVVDQAPGTTGRVTVAGDEASKVPFRKTQDGETFKWKVTLTATDGKAIAAGVADTKLDLTMHCLRTDGAVTPAAAAATAAPAPKPAAAPAPAPAAAPAKPAPAKAAPAPAPAPAKAAPVPAPAKAAPAPAPAPAPAAPAPAPK